MRPVDFMVSLRDFFALLVPGAVLLWLLPAPEGDFKLGALGIFAFAVGAYLAGSVASGIGAIADHAIDPLFRWTQLGFLKRFRELRSFEDLAKALGKDAMAPLFKPLLADGSEQGDDAARKLSAEWSAKTFWWTQIRIHCAPGLLELDRIEANQKLFRSLIVVFAFLALVQGAWGGTAERFSSAVSALERHHIDRVGVWLALAMGSLLPYAIGRFHFARTVYGLAVTLCLQRIADGRDARTDQPGG